MLDPPCPYPPQAPSNTLGNLTQFMTMFHSYSMERATGHSWAQGCTPSSGPYHSQEGRFRWEVQGPRPWAGNCLCSGVSPTTWSCRFLTSCQSWVRVRAVLLWHKGVMCATPKYKSSQLKLNISSTQRPLYSFPRISLASSVPPEMKGSVTKGKSECKERAVLVTHGWGFLL